MSKVITHTREKIITLKKGQKVRTKHEHFTQADTGFIPGSTNTAVNIKIAKRGR